MLGHSSTPVFSVCSASRLQMLTYVNAISPVLLFVGFLTVRSVRDAAVENAELDYINSPAHCCIMQPPVAPSGDSTRVIA